MWHHGIDVTKENDGTIVYAVEINKTDVPPDVHVASGYVLHHPDGSKVNIITEVHDAGGSIAV